MYHALLDEIIPYALGKNLHDQYCARGVTVQFQTYPAADHILGLVEPVPAATSWLADRFTGQPATSDCYP